MKIFSGTQSNYDTGIVSDERSWSASLECSYEGYWRAIPSNCLKTFTLSDNATNGSNISMGDVLGGELQTSFINITTDDLSLLKEGRQVRIKLTLENADVTLVSKIFIVDSAKIKRRGDTYNAEITAYDPTYKMTYTYVANAEKMTALQVVTQIANKYGLGVDASVSEAIAVVDGSTPYQFTMLADFTDKDTLGYMAGCYGCNASVNEEHNICFVWYENTDEEIRSDRIYMGGQYVSEMESRTIVMLETGTKDNPITYPSVATGHSINYENPYITATQAEAIYNVKIADGKIKFNVGKTKYKGNPLNGAGKIVKVFDTKNEEATVYIMKRKLTYGGGLSETIECLGESKTSTRYSISSPTQQKIDRALSKMEEAIKSATDAITQTKGSVFEFIPVDENDPTQGNAGYNLYYKDNTDPAFDDCLIQATAGGVGFSTDGGETFDGAAMYFYKDESGEVHGAVNSEFLRAGSITADKLAADSITADKIKAGAVTADKVQAGAITADKLNIGTAKESNMYSNPNFSEYTEVDGRKKPVGWSSLNAYIDSLGNYGVLWGNDPNKFGFYQGVYMTQGRYALTTRVRFVEGVELGTDPNISVKLGDGSVVYPSMKIDNDTIANGMNREVVFKFVFNYRKEDAFTEIGLLFNNIDVYISNSSRINVAWMSLVPTDEAAGFYCSNSSWLVNDVLDTNLIDYFEPIGNTLKNINPFQVNEAGKLKVVEGQIGGFEFSENVLFGDSFAYLNAENGEAIKYESQIKIIKPYGTVAFEDIGSEYLSEGLGALAPRIVITNLEDPSHKTTYGLNHLRFKSSLSSTYIDETVVETDGDVIVGGTLYAENADFTNDSNTGSLLADKGSFDSILTESLTVKGTIYTQSSSWVGLQHTCTGRGITKTGTGTYNGNPTAALEIDNTAGTKLARLDVYDRGQNNSRGTLIVQNSSGISSPLDIGVDDMWLNGKPIFSTLEIHTTRLGSIPSVIDGGQKTNVPIDNTWTYVSFNKMFSSTPRVVCSVEQKHSGTDETYSVCIGETTASGFNVKLKKVTGDLEYNCAINWVAIS